jgi:tetratricopeptide (TPR) repeat protein
MCLLSRSFQLIAASCLLMFSGSQAADAGMECLNLYPVLYTLQTGDSANETRIQRTARTEQLLSSRLKLVPEQIVKLLIPLAESISRSTQAARIDQARASFVLGVFETSQIQALEAGDEAHRATPRRPEMIIAALQLAALAAIEQSRHEEAVKFVTVALGETSADKDLATWTQLQKITARAYRGLDMKKDEERIQRHILTEHQRILGENHIETIRQHSELAGLLYQQGNDLESERETRAVLKATLRLHGPDSDQATIVRKNLARVLEAQGRHSEATPFRKQVLEAALKTSGKESAPALAAREALVKNLAAQKSHAECEAEARILMESAQSAAGPDTALTMNARIYLAVSVFEQGRYEEALQMLDQLQKDSSRLFGADHAQTLLVIHTRGTCLNTLKRHDEAAVTLTKTLEARKRVLPADDLATLETRLQLGQALLNLGRLKEALAEIRITANAYQRLLPAGDPRMRSIADLSNQFSSLEEGRQILIDEHRANYRTAASTYGTEDLQTLNVQAGLAAYLAGMGRSDEALVEYEKVLSICRRKLGPDNPGTLDLLQRTALIHLNEGRFETCEKMLREVLAYRQKNHKPGDLGVDETRYHLGVCLGQMGQLRQADEMVRQSLEAVKAEPQANPAFVAQMEQMQARIQQAMAPRPPATDAVQSAGMGAPGTLQSPLQLKPAGSPTQLPAAVQQSRLPDIDPASLVPSGTIQKPLEYKP